MVGIDHPVVVHTENIYIEAYKHQHLNIYIFTFCSNLSVSIYNHNLNLSISQKKFLDGGFGSNLLRLHL